jgi:hypothetical protein
MVKRKATCRSGDRCARPVSEKYPPFCEVHGAELARLAVQFQSKIGWGKKNITGAKPVVFGDAAA